MHCCHVVGWKTKITPISGKTKRELRKVQSNLVQSTSGLSRCVYFYYSVVQTSIILHLDVWKKSWQHSECDSRIINWGNITFSMCLFVHAPGWLSEGRHWEHFDVCCRLACFEEATLSSAYLGEELDESSGIIAPSLQLSTIWQLTVSLKWSMQQSCGLL